MELRDVLQRLVDECAKVGGQKAWATQYGLSPQHVNDVVHGRREPGPGVLIPLGLQRVVTYAPLPPRAEPKEAMRGGVLLTEAEREECKV